MLSKIQGYSEKIFLKRRYLFVVCMSYCLDKQDGAASLPMLPKIQPHKAQENTTINKKS
jgi:hypothetical protein